MKINQKGFTLIEGLLTVLVIAFISFVGWYVWNSNQDKNNSTKSDTSDYVSIKSEKATDPTEDWITYHTDVGKFTVKYPKEWVTSPNKDACDETLLLLGADSGSVGHCNSDSGGQIIISSTDGVQPASSYSADNYKDITSKNVTVQGVKGTRQSGTVKADPEFGIGPPAGTKEVLYVFVTNGKTYTLNYIQQPSFKDVLSDFELLVTKTLKFE